MFAQAYGTAVAIVLVSVLVGRAICKFCGGTQRWWSAPAVGLASLIVLTAAAIKLPGRGLAAAIVCGLAVLVAVVYLLWKARPRFPVGDLLVGGSSLLGASILFIASGRVGLPGPTWDNDMAVHLLAGEALRSSRMAKFYGGLLTGYPTGPHSLAATLDTAFGVPLDMVFVGLLLATVGITALVAADVLAKEALWRRVIVGVLCSLAYMVVAYFGTAEFKETIMAALVLGFVLHLEQVRAGWGEATPARRLGLALPGGLLAAGAVYTYSYLGLAWFGATLALWAVAETARRPALALGWLSFTRIKGAAPWVAAFIVLGLIALIPIAHDVEIFFRSLGLSPAGSGAISTSTLGNLPGPVPPYEALGLWWSPDFRYPAANGFQAGELSVLALAALGYALVWSVRRRELVLPSALAGSALIWLFTVNTQSPYVTAKSLIIGAPLVMALVLRALLTRSERKGPSRAVWAVAATLYCAFAAYSSYGALRTEPVQPPEAGLELAAFHRRIGDVPVLFLGIDDFASWQLRDSPVDSPASSFSLNAGLVITWPEKPFNGLALDFNSIAPGDLDRFPYVITTNTPYASQPPANFHLVARGRLYELWKRTGPTVPFQTLDPPGQPGKILDCHTPAGAKIAASRGQATLMVEPVTAPGVSLSAGETGTMSLALPPGKWEISAEYISYFNLDFRAQGEHWKMPAYLGRNGPFFAVGEVTGHGTHSPVKVTATAERPSPLTGGDVTAVSVYELAATAVPDTRGVVPLNDACGRYVDWYRLT
ncbi:MAG TPA: hypothetical protein VIJ20_06960 [Solirubrobacteraceae bacterium]